MAQAKRKKKFFNVEIPILKKETQLYGYEIKEMKGRTISYDLTRLLKGKGSIMKFNLTVEENVAIANPIELKIMPFFIKRMTRKGTDYVEDSFSTNCKDAVLKVKPFLITRKRVSRSVRKALREKAQEELKKYLKTKPAKRIFEELMKNEIQKSLSLKLKKIYPLSLCEIRVLRIEENIEESKEINEVKKE